MAITGISLSTYSNLSGVVLHPNVRVRAMSAMESLQPASAVTPTATNVVPFPVESNRLASHPLRIPICYLLPSFRTLYTHRPQRHTTAV